MKTHKSLQVSMNGMKVGTLAITSNEGFFMV